MIPQLIKLLSFSFQHCTMIYAFVTNAAVKRITLFAILTVFLNNSLCGVAQHLDLDQELGKGQPVHVSPESGTCGSSPANSQVSITYMAFQRCTL